MTNKPNRDSVEKIADAPNILCAFLLLEMNVLLWMLSFSQLYVKLERDFS